MAVRTVAQFSTPSDPRLGWWIEIDPASESRVNFRLWEDTTFTVGEPPLFSDDHLGGTSDAPPVVSGSVKWDGCIDYEFPANRGEAATMLHNCSRGGLLSLGEALGEAWDRCILHMEGRSLVELYEDAQSRQKSRPPGAG